MEAWYEQSEAEHQDLGSFDPAVAKGRPLDVRFGRGLRLVDVRLPSDPRAPFGKKRNFGVEYVFESDEPPDGKLRIDASFLVARGGRFHDSETLEIGSPGTVTEHTQKVTIPSTTLRGRYVLWMSVREGKKRLPVHVGDSRMLLRKDQVALGFVSVER